MFSMRFVGSVRAPPTPYPRVPTFRISVIQRKVFLVNDAAIRTNCYRTAACRSNAALSAAKMIDAASHTLNAAGVPAPEGRAVK
ncbi:hypothetical protein SKAU_G00169370 [Synaphobranchus kaupii]|uniref:Uncharacterized protein n=1 Tax=Synaphobranchus kaupii TaxID=118154 RepID=A0A9Q1FK23_SYNKA|nr:hypothetical protein SKAU_G00169370 [Synaphobranchus kaupii]